MCFSKLPWFGKVGIALYILCRHVLWYFQQIGWGYLVGSIGTILYFVGKDTISLSTVDYLFIAFAILSDAGIMLGWLVHRYIIAPKLYDEWLRVYDPQWPEGEELTWFRRGRTVMNFIVGAS
jgi:hypothetical protein